MTWRPCSMREQYDKNEVDQDARIKEIEKINREKVTSSPGSDRAPE